MKQQPESKPQAASAPEFQRRPDVLYNPDGTPMHWSEAAKHRYGLRRGSTSLAVGTPPAQPTAAPMPVVPEPAPQPAAEPEPEPPVEPKPKPAPKPEPEPVPQPAAEPAVEIQIPPKVRREGDRVPWSASVGILVIIAVLALGGAVIPFCVMNWESLEWSGWFGGSTSDVATSATMDTEAEASSTEQPGATEASAVEGAATDAAAAAAAATEASPTETQGEETSGSHLSAGGTLTFETPTGWAPMTPELVADYQPNSTYLATVVETAGPTLAGVFLNAMAVKVLDVPQGESLAPALTQQAVQSFVDGGLDSYGYFKVLTPTRESTVGSFYAHTATARITWNERVLVKSVYVFIAGDNLYQVELYVDDVDWGDYRDIFEGILDSFALADGTVTPQ